jgi:hypothetical protein
MRKTALIVPGMVGLAATGFASGAANAGMPSASGVLPAAATAVDVVVPVFYRCRRQVPQVA